MSTRAPLHAGGLVLAGVLPDRLDRLQIAMMRLHTVGHQEGHVPGEEMFEAVDKDLWKMLSVYYTGYRSVLPTAALFARLEREADPAVRSGFADLWVRYRDTPVPDDQFEWALSETYEHWRDAESLAALTRAREILLTGYVNTDNRGKTETRRGYQAMRDDLARRWHILDSAARDATPEAELVDEYDAMVRDVGSAQNTDAPRVRTGVEVLDMVTAGGIGLGDLWFLAAYAGHGKSTFAIGVMAYQAVMAGRNVVYMTGETLRTTTRRRFVCRHTRSPVFGLPSGVDSLAVKSGVLPDHHLQVYHAAAADLVAGMEEGRYGRLLIRQIPLRNHFADITATLDRVEARWPVDMLIVDSIDMIRTPRQGWSYREQLSESIESFAGLAISHAGGRGLMVVSPYQINRASFNEALAASGRYELSSLSETAMAERRASLVLSLLVLPDAPAEVRAQVLKNREGPITDFTMERDAKTAWMGAGAAQAAALSAADLMV